MHKLFLLISKKYFFRKMSAVVLMVLLPFGQMISMLGIQFPNKTGPEPEIAQAAYHQFSPVAGNLVNGTAVANSATNMASYRGALATDNVFWSVLGTASGLDVEVTLGGVTLNGGNKMILTSETANVTTARAYFVQICDWVTSTGVDNAADSNCTTGGWRTLNIPKATALSNTADATSTFEIYNGYFYSGTGPGTAINTPLSNFISGSNTTLVRYYSTVNSVAQFNIDRVQLETAVDPVYYPSNLVKNGSFTGAITGDYMAAQGSENSRVTITNTNANAMDVYFSFKNIQTYTGANTILVNFEGGYVSTVAFTYDLGIWNFDTSSWEDLHVGTIASNTGSSDQQNYFAKNNVTLSDYISGGETRIRLVSTVTGTQTHAVDRIFITVGSTNVDTAQSEVTFGDDNATTASNTRDLDAETGAVAGTTWQVASCATAVAPCATTPYTGDFGGTYGTHFSNAQNLSIPLTVPAGASVTGIRYAARFRSGSASKTNQLDIFDSSGTSIASGWVPVGSVSQSVASYVFTEGIYQVRPADSINSIENTGNLRLRTSTNTSTVTSTTDWDFAFMSIRWATDASNRGTIQSKFMPTAGNLITGVQGAVSATNMASYRAALSTDNIYWTVDGTASGFDMQIMVGDVQLLNANKLIITSEARNITTARNFDIYVCDFVSSTGVDLAADANCTTGGWRKVNNPKATALNPTTDTIYTTELYNGYFYSGTNPGTTIDTPLSNFVSSSNNVLVRFYSTVNSAVQFALDQVKVETAIDPQYYPESYNAIAPFAGAVSGDKMAATTSNNIRQSVTNTAGNAMNFYYSFKNVRTYTGANTILVNYEGGFVSAVTLTYNLAIWNFNTSSWEDLHTGQITASGASADQLNYFAKNNVTLTDYISSGEVRIRVYSSVTGTQTFQTDQIYITVGSTNTSTGDSETSFGDDNATTVTNTRDIDVLTTSTGGNTWQVATCLNNTAPCATTPYAADFATTYGTNYSAAENVSMPITLSSLMSITGLRFANRFRSNVTTNTVQVGIFDYSGQFVGSTVAGGWIAVGTTNAATTYTFSDGMYQINADDLIDLTNNKVNVRLRTGTSTAVTTATRDWDFAMVAPRWVEIPVPTSVTYSISENTIGFGSLSSAAARYATADSLGSASEVEAHQITASSNSTGGYTLLVSGPTLTSDVNTITAIGSSNTASSVGTDQFGLRATATGGSGTVSAPFSASGFAYDDTASQNTLATNSSNDGVATTYSVRYLANEAATTPAGAYTSTLTYILVPNF